MADTTALNTGKKSDVNTRLVKYFNETIGRDIHTLKCLFHVKEVYLSHIVSMINGRKKGLGMMEDGALLNNISAIQKPIAENLVPRKDLVIRVTNIAAVHLKATPEWFSNQKRNGMTDHCFQSDQLCVLVLACHVFSETLDNLKNLVIQARTNMPLAMTFNCKWIPSNISL